MEGQTVSPAHNPCLLIPIYNQGPLVEATLARLQHLGLPCLIVDDGSDAATQAVLDAAAARHDWISLRRLPKNSGKGVAALTGIAWARELGYSHAVQLDADGQHTVEDIPKLLEMSRAEPQALVSAAPIYDENVPKSRLYGRYITHFWVWVETLSLQIVDSMCGFRVYPVAASDDLAREHPIGRRMDFDTDIMVRLYWRGLPVRFLRSRVVYPDNGISNFAPFADNVRITLMHTKLVLGMPLRIPMLLRQRRAHKARNKEAQHWSQVRESGAYAGMWFMASAYRLIGRRGLHLMLYPVIGYFFLRNGQARAASRQFLFRVRTFTAGTEAPTPGVGDSFRHFMSFGRSIVDRVGSWKGDINREQIVYNGREHLLRLVEQGRGGVLLSSHLGNIELLRAMVRSSPGIRINVLVFAANARSINRVMKKINPDADIELIPVTSVDPGTAIMLKEKVARGEFVVIAADRTSPTAPEKSLRVPFLGHDASFPQGAFVLAGLLQSPVLLVFCLQRGRYHFFIEQFSDNMSMARSQRAELLREHVARYALRLQHYAQMAPEQWFNFYDFWAPPAGSADRPAPPARLAQVPID
ncbi:MAG: glycosyltransferase family 2 protein [Halioglobus sp.]|nr:glycosyltransferase family 2 protein [Halioglobus sp.]